MFRRTKPEPTAPETDADKAPGKGRPTPSRREAEAAAKARARAPRTRKELAAQQRQARADANARTRQAMVTGEDRYLPERDRGPVRHFIRDFVDVRLSYIEVMVPLLLVTLILGWTGLDAWYSYANTALFALMLLLIFNTWRMVRQLKRELAERFPGKPVSGATWYAVSRTLQMKFMRRPVPQVKLGQVLPDSYR